MFGQDLLTGLQQLLAETTRYLGEVDGKLDLTALEYLPISSSKHPDDKGKEQSELIFGPSSISARRLGHIEGPYCKSLQSKVQGGV